jgi:hypothetical protein
LESPRVWEDRLPASQGWEDPEVPIGMQLYNLFLSLRPHQWTKNLLVFSALVFAQELHNLPSVVAAVEVDFSNWLLIVTMLLALFLTLSKRRHELTLLAAEAAEHRRIRGEYSPYLLDQMIAVVTASTVVSYALYTQAPETVTKFGTDRLVWTLPFVLYGIFRYLYLVHQRDEGGNPSRVLLNDRPILAAVALWTVAVVAIIYHFGESG